MAPNEAPRTLDEGALTAPPADRLRLALLLPLATWLIGQTIFTVFGVERLFADEHAAFVYARLTAYLTSMTTAALTLGFAALFGLSCGIMLWWLDDAVGRSADRPGGRLVVLVHRRLHMARRGAAPAAAAGSRVGG